MQISIIQAILIGTLYYLTNNGVPWLTGLGSVSIRQPICAGTIVGLILGKPVEGCIMGATINTLYLGFVNAGGTLPTDPGIGGVVGTALALSANATPQVAMSINFFRKAYRWLNGDNLRPMIQDGGFYFILTLIQKRKRRMKNE